MTSAPPPLPATDAPGGLYDGRWTQLMVFLLHWLPVWVCVFLTIPIVACIYPMAFKQGHAVRSNLRAMFPSWSRLRIWLGGYRVFREFGLTYMDRLLHQHRGLKVEWDVQGMEYFEQLKRELTGALVFTVHSGNYDIGSSLLAQALGRPLHTVRLPERTQSLEALRAAELSELGGNQPLLRFHYNTPDRHLGIDLCRLLSAGEFVAVQGDRVVMDVSPITISHDGVRYTMPQGPLMLAEIARVPCYSIFLTRIGVCSYRIEIQAPFHQGGTRTKRAELASLWVPVMADFIYRNWSQWFVFEAILERETQT